MDQTGSVFYPTVMLPLKAPCLLSCLLFEHPQLERSHKNSLTKEAANNLQSTTPSCCPRLYKSLTFREHLLPAIWADCFGSLSATQHSPAEHTHTHADISRQAFLTACTCILLFLISPHSAPKRLVLINPSYLQKKKEKKKHQTGPARKADFNYLVTMDHTHLSKKGK
ncbi:hypothetical protein CCH79_00012045 [Gambusia affinis]|uniref:Uncharacterized protein n=1 Tax=Gambusia affinis TaxID=33528 RepID=A0A315W968_GAMAF|nr:hypothetical protein CCH79_00012045 [Gambusia affinis]